VLLAHKRTELDDPMTGTFSLSSIYGSNLHYLTEYLSHVSQLMVPSFRHLLERSDLIVLGQKLLDEELALLYESGIKNASFLDLVGAVPLAVDTQRPGSYTLDFSVR